MQLELVNAIALWQTALNSRPVSSAPPVAQPRRATTTYQPPRQTDQVSLSPPGVHQWRGSLFGNIPQKAMAEQEAILLATRGYTPDPSQKIYDGSKHAWQPNRNPQLTAIAEAQMARHIANRKLNG